jgi:hypothetical protein
MTIAIQPEGLRKLARRIYPRAATNYQLPITNYQLPITNYHSPFPPSYGVWNHQTADHKLGPLTPFARTRQYRVTFAGRSLGAE